MYETLEELMKEKGVNATEVSKATGIARSNFTDWKKGRAYPKADKLQLLADYFNVPIDTFTTGRKPTAIFRKKTQRDNQALIDDIVRIIGEHQEDGYPVYYKDEATAKAAQEVFSDPDLRMLFDAAKSAKPEDIRLAADLLKRMKGGRDG